MLRLQNNLSSIVWYNLFLLSDIVEDENTTESFTSAFKIFLNADIVLRTSLRVLTGEKIAAVRAVVGEVAFQQGMKDALGGTFQG